MLSERPSRQGQFCWYELITTNTESAKTFYSNVMGWGVLNTSMPDRRYSLFSAGTVLVGGLMELPKNTPRTGTEARWIGYVGVDDVDATASRIAHLGGTVQVPRRKLPMSADTRSSLILPEGPCIEPSCCRSAVQQGR
jgi:predicted enzyme related to lactoylglutathione lyase